MSTIELDTRPLAFGRRLTQAARGLAFLVVSLPLGLAYLLALPIALLAGPLVVRRLLEIERALANRLLCARSPAPAPVTTDSRIERHQIACLVAKFPLSVCAAAICALPLALLIELLALAVRGFSGSASYLGQWDLGPVTGLVLLLLAAPAFVVCVAALQAAGSLFSWVDRHGLASHAPGSVPVREALAERLGDRTLAIAYWLPERKLFVDERGDPVALPQPGTGRTWTAVEHHGFRVAAIIHDAELDARPELVEAAAAGAVLALDNERLKADLRAKLHELHASRRRIVEASAETRRQLERDLHDGAQQRLVSLSLDLQLLRRKVADHAAAEMVDGAIRTLREALTELRELARGIHPVLLSDRGLPPALDSLAQRSPVPVELDLELEGRLPIEVETAAYFVAAEALTNVAKHGRASFARVRAASTDGVLTLAVSDDGVGGAQLNGGGGLRGLADRVAAIDGQLTIDSPPGSGTRVAATIPYTEHGT
ncbi:MAG TPA: histidine kinase [Solirubrobacteraceae bacterium]|nr:histidine kinase [Solirubrobacteraceae bacterium]